MAEDFSVRSLHLTIAPMSKRGDLVAARSQHFQEKFYNGADKNLGSITTNNAESTITTVNVKQAFCHTRGVC
jgi:hypothetical protein